MGQTMRLEIGSLDETERLGHALGLTLQPGCLVGLQGNLGTGKTTLTRSIARELGIESAITSPTFTIERRHPIPSTEKDLEGGLLRHWDFYRLDENSDLEELGFYDRQPGEYLLVEWIERLPEVLTEPGLVMIRLETPDGANEPDRRIVEITAPDAWLAAFQNNWDGGASTV
jgi:tRNA threonylcarbamoyladenosine biosynthesis protein TsaE